MSQTAIEKFSPFLSSLFTTTTTTTTTNTATSTTSTTNTTNITTDTTFTPPPPKKKVVSKKLKTKAAAAPPSKTTTTTTRISRTTPIGQNLFYDMMSTSDGECYVRIHNNNNNNNSENVIDEISKNLEKLSRNNNNNNPQHSPSSTTTTTTTTTTSLKNNGSPTAQMSEPTTSSQQQQQQQQIQYIKPNYRQQQNGHSKNGHSKKQQQQQIENHFGSPPKIISSASSSPVVVVTLNNLGNSSNNNSNNNGTVATIVDANSSTSSPISFMMNEYPWLYPGEKILYKVNHVAYIQSKHFVDHEHCYTGPEWNTNHPAQTHNTTITNSSNSHSSSSNGNGNENGSIKNNQVLNGSHKRVVHGALFITNYQIRFVKEKFADDDSDDESESSSLSSPSSATAALFKETTTNTKEDNLEASTSESSSSSAAVEAMESFASYSSSRFSVGMCLSAILNIEERLPSDSGAFKRYFGQNQGGANGGTNGDDTVGSSSLSFDAAYFSSTPLGLHNHQNMSYMSSNDRFSKNGSRKRHSEEDCSGILQIYGKDIRSMKLAFFGTSDKVRSKRLSTQQHAQDVDWNSQTTLRELNYILTNMKTPKNMFAFQFGLFKEQVFSVMFHKKPVGNEWGIYDPLKDFARQGLHLNDSNSLWRLSDANVNYALCDTYPKYLAVPKSITDDQLKGCSTFRSKGRIPALTWVHPSQEKGGCIIRCSQPMVGVMRSRSREDEDLIEGIRKNCAARKVHIIDCRPKANALAQTVMGRGYEDVTYYSNCTIEFMGIDNIHAMHSSLHTLTKLCQKSGDTYWLSSLENTGWLRHCRLILQCSQRIVELVEHKRMAVIIHCSDGWDRTSQVSALSQLLLDPYYRTIRGFELLIEKEWCSFGHKFLDRLGHTRNSSLSDEVSPVFLQFIDCVYQIMRQFPDHFEFDERLLITILDHTYSCLFGNFLHNSDKERENDALRSNTVSLWTFINSNRQQFVNRLYNRKQAQKSRTVLLPDSEIDTLSAHFWVGYFYRYRMGKKSKYQIMVDQALFKYQTENSQMKKKLMSEKQKRESAEKELQAYKNRMAERLKILGQDDPSIFEPDLDSQDGYSGSPAHPSNDAEGDESDQEEESHLIKIPDIIENFYS